MALHTSDLAVGTVGIASAFLVVLGAFLNLFQSGLQIIGLGTAISLCLTTAKLIYDRREDQRKKTSAGIQRLQPSVYNPILSWAVVAGRTLQAEPEAEFAVAFGPPPDLSTNGDYVAVVGDGLHSALERTNEAHHAYTIRAARVREEYGQRLEQKVETIHPNWKSVWLYFDGSEWDMHGLVFGHNFRTIENLVRSAKKIEMSASRKYDGGNTEACPTDFVDALLQPTILSSFKPFGESKNSLKIEIGKLLTLTKNAITNGEPDWRL